jgi:hypothetical protein
MHALLLAALLPAAAPAQDAPDPVSVEVRDSGRSRCDLGRSKSLPALVLVGGDHEYHPDSREDDGEAPLDEPGPYNSETSANSDEVNSLAVRYAAEGRLFAAFEAARSRAFYPGAEDLIFSEFGVKRQGRSRVFGIEAPFAHGLASSYVYATTNPSWEGFLFYLRLNPYLCGAWQDVRESLGSGDEASGLAAVADLIERSRAAAVLDPRRPDEIRGANSGHFYGLLERVNARFVDLANENLASLGISEPLVAPAPASSPCRAPGASKNPLLARSCQLRFQAWRRSFKIIEVPLRDRDMFDNIADVYCRAAREGKALVVSVGANHVPGIERLLRRWSGGRIPLTTNVW